LQTTNRKRRRDERKRKWGIERTRGGESFKSEFEEKENCI
jgi:hypothetical protein